MSKLKYQLNIVQIGVEPLRLNGEIGGMYGDFPIRQLAVCLADSPAELSVQVYFPDTGWTEPVASGVITPAKGPKKGIYGLKLSTTGGIWKKSSCATACAVPAPSGVTGRRAERASSQIQCP